MGSEELSAPKQLRFDRIVFLFDPDADGIHIGALMLLFFYRWLRPVLDEGHLYVIRAPLFEIATPDRSTIQLGYTEEEYRETLRRSCDATGLKKQRYRRLGSINEDVLYRSCVKSSNANHPSTHFSRRGSLPSGFRRQSQLAVTDEATSPPCSGRGNESSL